MGKVKSTNIKIRRGSVLATAATADRQSPPNTPNQAGGQTRAAKARANKRAPRARQAAEANRAAREQQAQTSGRPQRRSAPQERTEHPKQEQPRHHEPTDQKQRSTTKHLPRPSRATNNQPQPKPAPAYQAGVLRQSRAAVSGRLCTLDGRGIMDYGRGGKGYNRSGGYRFSEGGGWG